MCQVLGEPRDFSGQLFFLYRQVGAAFRLTMFQLMTLPPAATDMAHYLLLDCCSLGIRGPVFPLVFTPSKWRAVDSREGLKQTVSGARADWNEALKNL